MLKWNNDPRTCDANTTKGGFEGRDGTRRGYLRMNWHYIGDHGYSLFANAKAIQFNRPMAHGCCMPSREAAITALEEVNAVL